ncbi:MAG TPA: sensor histidine kinase [Gemmatimonadaceae bacterium]|jgi:signal transduction histidine kinase
MLVDRAVGALTMAEGKKKTRKASSLDVDCPLARILAERLRSSRHELTEQWLARIANRVSLHPNLVFPTEELLDHVPLLLEGVADYVENPAAEVGIHMPVVAKAMELGELRHQQGFDAYEILKEYEFLGGILFAFFTRTVDEIDEPCEKSELMACGSRLYRAVTIIQQSTMTHFLLLADKHVAEREERLRAFNRVISHEIKNRLAALLGASGVLSEIPDMAPEKRAELIDIVLRNSREMQDTVDNVLVLSRTDLDDPRRHRNVMLPRAVTEAVRQVREAAHSADIDVRILPGMPEVELRAAVIELCIKNYLSNAIKYCDPAKSDRFIEISGTEERTESGGFEVVLRVRDNGIGVPIEKREHLFERFFRAHEGMTAIEGTGLGLNIVRETVESQGGRAWAEQPAEGGSIFAIALPLRRGPDTGTHRIPETTAAGDPRHKSIDQPIRDGA